MIAVPHAPRSAVTTSRATAAIFGFKGLAQTRNRGIAYAMVGLLPAKESRAMSVLVNYRWRHSIYLDISELT